MRCRGLDFRRSREVFATMHLTRVDNRRECGEQRFIAAGRSLIELPFISLDTPRSRPTSYIVRKANAREIKALAPHVA